MSGHVEALLSAFLDDELAPAERSAVEAHLAKCPDCSAHLAELAALDAAARRVPVEAPEGYYETFAARVRRSIEGRKARSWSPPHWGWAVAAAALLAVVTPLTLHEVGRPVPEPAVAPAAARPQAVATEPASAPGEQAPGLEKKGLGDNVTAAVPQKALGGRADLGSAVRSEEKEERADRAAPAPTPAPPAPALAGPAAFASAPPPATASEGIAGEVVARSETDAVGRAVARERRADRDLGEPDGARAGADVAAGVTSAASPTRLAEEAPPPPRTAEEARGLRELWRRRAEGARDPRLADAAWVHVIEAGAAAWRLGDDPEDLQALRKDARAYLARTDARETERVRAILSESEE